MTKILIVEDEAALAEPLAFLLEREGYDGRHSRRRYHGADALRL